jgi:hypothetical protein
VRLLNKKNKRRGCLVSILAIITTIVLTTTLSLFKLTSNNVYADGELAPADSLLLKVIKERMKECISHNILTKADVSSSGNNITAINIFNFAGLRYSEEINILYKYGAGNTLNDPKLTCEQLFGFDSNINGGGSFKTYESLGGNAKPPLDNRAATTEMKNKFLEAIGYTPENGGQQNKFYCGHLVYYVAADANSQGGGEKRTPSICINVDESGNVVPSSGDKISLMDLAPPSGGDSDIITLDYTGDPIKFQVNIKTPGNLQGCTTYSETILTGNPLNSFINRPASQVFDELINKAASKGNSFPGNTHSHGNLVVPGQTGRPVNMPCDGSTVAEAFKSNSVTFRKAEPDSARTSEGGNAEDGRRQKYKYTGPPEYDKLINYYVPNYTLDASNSAITDLEKAYYWYYLLKDVFEGISVDLSLETPCSDSASAAGQNYLKYHNVHIGDPSQAVDKFCTLDSNTLNHKSDQAIVPGFDNGLVPSISSTNALRDMNVNDVLTALNGLNLVSLCEQDGNFPLCKADPATCAKDPDNAGCKEIANNATDSGEDEKAGEQAECMKKSGAFGWLICPMMFGLRDTANGIFQKSVTPLLVVHTSIVKDLADTRGQGSTLYQAWSFFRNVANIMFVIAMLFVIFSQITGFGIDNYGIKKILPKLIITAIIVNFSYVICGIIVDISNLAGDALRGIFEGIADGTTGTSDRENITGGVVQIIASLVNAIAPVAATGAAAGGITYLVVTGITASASGSFLAFIFPILSIAGAAALAGLFAMLMLGLRQSLIIIMIAISPIAFVLYAIPNTNALFKKWFSLVKTLLVIYPVFCFLVGGGALVSKIIINSDTDFYMRFIAGLLSIMPYFAVPAMTRNAVKGFDGLANGLSTLQKQVGNAGNFANRKVMGSDLMKTQQQNAQTHKLQQLVGKYKDVDKSKLKPWQQRRFAAAVSALNKDEHNRAGLDAAMREYEYNTDPRNAANINRSAMRRLNDTIQNDMMSEFKSNNMSAEDALRELNRAQEYEYDKGAAEDNRANDNRIGALTSYLASTKDGQKAFDKYVKGKYVDSTGHALQPGKSSDRAMAVIQQTMQDKHSDLRDKYHTTFEQLDTKRATQDIESMMGPTQDANRLSSGMPATTRKVARELDFDDYSKMGKQDFEQFYNTNKGSNGAPDTYSAQYAAGSDEYNHLNELANSRVKQLKSDPSLISTLSDQEKRFISAYSTGNVDVNTISSVLYMKDAGGTVTGTIEQS